MAKVTLSKFNVDPVLFKPEPPTEPRQVKKLFHGREDLFRMGLNRLKTGLDSFGKRGISAGKYPWVIHGESRSGKSHLARRIFAELPENEKQLQIRVVAGGKLDAVSVMREVFEDMRQQFSVRINNQRSKIDQSRTAEVQLVMQLVDRIGLFDAGTQSATLAFEESNRKSREIGGEIGGEWTTIPFVGKMLGKFVSKFQRERSEKTGVQLSLRPPNAIDLAEVCGIMAETLFMLGLARHVLVLLDDFDLLETYVSPMENAKTERSLLTHAVRLLHSVPGVDVVLTVRSWYFHSEDKQLLTLVDLFEHPMPANEMLGIYDLRLQVFAPKNPSAAFINREALEKLADDVSGFPGIFLQHLHTAFYSHQNERDSMQRGYAWLLRCEQHRLDALKNSCSPGYEAIRDAVTKGQVSIDVRNNNPFFGTRLENEYVYQSYFSESSYFISGLVKKLFPPTD